MISVCNEQAFVINDSKAFVDESRQVRRQNEETTPQLLYYNILHCNNIYFGKCAPRFRRNLLPPSFHLQVSSSPVIQKRDDMFLRNIAANLPRLPDINTQFTTT
jgi:hypothetical protein